MRLTSKLVVSLSWIVFSLVACKFSKPAPVAQVREDAASGVPSYKDFLASHSDQIASALADEKKARDQIRSEGGVVASFGRRAGAAASDGSTNEIDYLRTLKLIDAGKAGGQPTWQTRNAICFENLHEHDFAADADVGDVLGANSRYSHGDVRAAEFDFPPFSYERTSPPPREVVERAAAVCKDLFGDRTFRFLVDMIRNTDPIRVIVRSGPPEGTDIIEGVKAKIAQGFDTVKKLEKFDKANVQFTDEYKRMLGIRLKNLTAMYANQPPRKQMVIECLGSISVPYQVDADAAPQSQAQEAVLDDVACTLAKLLPNGSDEFFATHNSDAATSVIGDKYRPMLGSTSILSLVK